MNVSLRRAWKRGLSRAAHRLAELGSARSARLSTWIEAPAVFVALCWVVIWERMNPLGTCRAIDLGKRALALRHEGHGSRAAPPRTLPRRGSR